MTISSRTVDLSSSVLTWMRSHVRFAPERRHANYFGQPYCPECQKTGRDNVLQLRFGSNTLVCSLGHEAGRNDVRRA